MGAPQYQCNDSTSRRCKESEKTQLIAAYATATPVTDVASDLSHPATIRLRASGIGTETISRLSAQVGQLAVGPAQLTVLFWPALDLDGNAVGLLAEVLTPDGEVSDRIDYGCGYGLVEIASGSGVPVLATDLATGLAAAAGTSRAVMVHVRGRLVLPAAMRSIRVALPDGSSDRSRGAISAGIWRQRRRLDSIRVYRGDLTKRLGEGGRSAVEAALAGAPLVYLRRAQRVARLLPDASPVPPPVPELDGCGAAARVAWEMDQLLARAVAEHNAGSAPAARVMIKAPAGGGKTEGVLTAADAVDGVVTIAVPDYKMARELLARALEKKLDASVTYAKLKPLDPAADDDDPDAERYCKRARVVMGLRKSGMDIGEGPVTCSVKIKDDDGKSIVLNCPYYDDCTWRNQRIATINIVTHESLFHDPHPGLAAAISKTSPFLVIDEKLNYIDHCDISVADINSHNYIDSWVTRLLVGDGMLDRRRVAEVIALCRNNGDLDGMRARLKKSDSNDKNDKDLFVDLLREQAQALRISIRGRPTPDRPDHEILDWAGRHRYKRPQVAALLTAVATWIEFGKTDRCAVYCRDGVIQWDRARPLADAWRSATIVALDASDRLALRHPALRDAETHVFTAPRRARVIQLADRELGKSGFMISPDGDRRVGEINDFLAWLAKAQGIGGLIAQKDVLERLTAPVGWAALNFGGLRGKDCLKKFDVGVVIGRMRPTPEAVDRIVRAIDPDLARPGEDFVAATEPLVAKDGAAIDVQVVRGVTPLHDEVLRSIRDDEILQAVDRFRLIHRQTPATIYLLTSVPLDGLQPDQLMTWRADVVDKDPMTAYLRSSVPANGRWPVAIPLDDEHMASIRTETGVGYFASEEAAKQARKRWSSSAAIKDFWRPAAADDPDNLYAKCNKCQSPIRLSRVFDTFRREVIVSITYRRVVAGRKAAGRASRALLAYSPPDGDDIDTAIGKMIKQADQLLRDALGVEVRDVKIHRIGVSDGYVMPEVDVLYGEGVARPDVRDGSPVQSPPPVAEDQSDNVVMTSWDSDDDMAPVRAPSDVSVAGSVDLGDGGDATAILAASPVEELEIPPNTPITYASFRSAFGFGPAVGVEVASAPARPAEMAKRSTPADAGPAARYGKLPIDGVFRYRAETGMIYLPVTALPADHDYGWTGGFVPGTKLYVAYDDEDDLDLWTPSGKAAWERRWDDEILLAAFQAAGGACYGSLA